MGCCVRAGGAYLFTGHSQPDVSYKANAIKTTAKGYRAIDFRGDGTRIEIVYPSYYMRGGRSVQPEAVVCGCLRNMGGGRGGGHSDEGGPSQRCFDLSLWAPVPLVAPCAPFRWVPVGFLLVATMDGAGRRHPLFGHAAGRRDWYSDVY